MGSLYLDSNVLCIDRLLERKLQFQSVLSYIENIKLAF